ncbi:MAG TPA: hypothetical protein VFI73_14285 [Candidatus Nitrosopolaris sp.]|nr:hypothetical protein [Candidatus Nitrosopolaris sp.]
MIDPEIKQLKARMENMENLWIECERKLDLLSKKMEGITDLLQKIPDFMDRK